MVETKRVVLLNIKTLGAGQPDYAQPEAVTTTEQTLIVKYPESEISANRYDDFVELHVTEAETEYIIGTQANLTKSGSWGAGIIAKNINFYTTSPVLVRFNYYDAIQHEIPPELLMSFSKRVEKFYVRAKNGTATVKAWIEG